MTDFLSDLERQLVAAHPRRRAARRRAAAGRALRAAPAVVAVLAVLAGAGAFVLSVGGEREAAERGAAPVREDVPTLGASTGELDPLPRGGLAILNGTTRPNLAAQMVGFLRPVGLVVGGNAPRQDLRRTRVRYAPGFRDAAMQIGAILDSRVSPLDAETRKAARAADLVVEVGSDVRGSRLAPLRPVEPGAEAGTVAVLDKAGPDDVLRITTVRYRRSPADGVWIADSAGRNPRFLGFTGGPSGLRKLEITVSPGVELRGRRLILSREENRPDRIGTSPRQPLFVADL
jgi:hypothetical protein